MDRRQFCEASSIGVIGFAIGGCSTPAKGYNNDASPALYGVGEEHLVFDAKSVAYQIDPNGHRVLTLDADARVVRQLGGLGDNAGELNYPIAGVIGPDQNLLYVLDRGNSRVQVFDRSRARWTGEFGRDQLNNPSDLAIDDQGTVYVADTANHRVLVFDRAGRVLRSIGKFGIDELGVLNAPRSIAITPAGELHVLDFDARIQVYTLEGQPRSRYGGYGTGRGQLISPSSLVADERGSVLVSEPTIGRISVFNGGTFARYFHPQHQGDAGAVPVRLATAHDDRLYVWTGGHEVPKR